MTSPEYSNSTKLKRPRCTNKSWPLGIANQPIGPLCEPIDLVLDGRTPPGKARLQSRLLLQETYLHPLLGDFQATNAWLTVYVVHGCIICTKTAGVLGVESALVPIALAINESQLTAPLLLQSGILRAVGFLFLRLAPWEIMLSKLHPPLDLAIARTACCFLPVVQH